LPNYITKHFNPEFDKALEFYSTETVVDEKCERLVISNI